MSLRDVMIGGVIGLALASMMGLDRGASVGAQSRVSAARGITQTCADYTALGTFQAPSVTEAGIIATGSGDINVLNFNGLGIVGGASDINVETGETIRFDFDGFQANHVTYRITGASNGDSSISGEALLTAFGFDGSQLGTVAVGGTGLFDVTTLFAGLVISGFELQPRDGDSLRVGEVCYAEEPPGCAADLDGDGDTDVLDFAEFLIDFGCTPDD